jgi:hypothetical protein
MHARPVDLRAVFPDATRSCGSNSGWYAFRLPDVVPHAVPASCPVVRASSLGIVQRSPLRRITRQGVLSRRPTARLPGRPTSFGTRLPPLIHVPTSWFCASSPVCSSLSGRVCCNAYPTLGFTTFQRMLPAVQPLRADLSCATTSPRDAFLPFEAFPPRTATGNSSLRRRLPAGARHHLDSHPSRCSPNSLPSRRCRSPLMGSRLPIPGASSRPQGLAPCPGPLLPRPLPAAGNPVLPWA